MGRKSSRPSPQSHILALGEVGRAPCPGSSRAHEVVAGTSNAAPHSARLPELRHGHARAGRMVGPGSARCAVRETPLPEHRSRVVASILGVRPRGARNNGKQSQRQEGRWGLPRPQTRALACKSRSTSTCGSPSAGEAFPPAHGSGNGIKIKDGKGCNHCRIKHEHLC